MVSILPLVSNSQNLSTKPFETVPCIPVSIGIIITLMFRNFFSSPSRSEFLFIFSLSITFTVILRTGTVIELPQSQGWRTCEHISCHQSLGTWVWRSKMSRTSLVQAERPVEFKRDFNIITRNFHVLHYCFTGDHWTFRNLRIDPSNRYIRKSSNEIWAVQDRFPNRFNGGARRLDPCHTPSCQQSDWYESISRSTITKPPSRPKRGGWTFSTYASWSARRERGRCSP